MKSKIFISHFLFILLLFNFCSKDTFIDIPKAETMPVINCLFSPDSTWTFEVYESVNVYDYTNFQFSKELVPKIYKNNSYLCDLYYTSENITKFPNTFYLYQYYTNSNFSVQENNNYSFEIITNNQKISGTSYIPEKPDISNLFLTEYTLNRNNNGNGGYYLTGNVKLTINTNNNTTKYYMIKLSYLADFYVMPGNLDTIRNEFLNFEINADYAFQAVNENEGCVIDGSDFEQTKTINLIINWHLEIEYYEPDKFFIEMRSITKDYYLYQKTLKQQSQTINDPFSESVSVHTNINNGLGIFSGYNSYKDTIFFD